MDFQDDGNISVFEFFKRYPDEATCIEYLEDLRWGEGGEYCPRCDCERVTRLQERPYYLCNGCRKKFTVRTGTIFERSHIPLQKWLYAMYIFEVARKGISSVQLSKQLGIHQESAWFMLHRLREACDIVAEPLSGTVEVDETFVGGKKSRMRYAQKKLLPPGPLSNKVPVMGLRNRETGKVIALPINDLTTRGMARIILKYVVRGSYVFTDEYHGYNSLHKWYEHWSINHTSGEYGDGDVHTNGIESIWAVLKRGYKGVYHHWSKKHMARYVNEFVFRLNNRYDSDNTMGRVENMIRNAFDKRLTYKQLTEEP